MLFNSTTFLFVFLPVVVAGYFLFATQRNPTQKSRWCLIWLVGCSLFFYGYWKPVYLWLLLGSICINFAIGRLLRPRNGRSQTWRKTFLIVGVASNLLLLGYYKYLGFLVTSWVGLVGSDLAVPEIFLPLAISFFTFQQIAFLVDAYKGEEIGDNFERYVLFVSFFPQLIAGPIVHHREMMPQFTDKQQRNINWNNIAVGLFTLSLGLFKKVAVADTFALWATHGFDHAPSLSLIPAWLTALSYTLQLYFDFSGYTDMAIGSALLFNIRLPANFNSPYKACNIQDFWRRWHMTLSRFLRDYVYIPLGGKRGGDMRLYRNLFITFLLGGIWHGAGWTFLFWGALNGLGVVVFTIWAKQGRRMFSPLAWGVHFVYLNICWVFFRSVDFTSAVKVLRGMFGWDGVVLPTSVSFLNPVWDLIGLKVAPIFTEFQQPMLMIVMVPLFVGITLWAPNSNEIRDKFKPNIRYAVWGAGLLVVALACLHRNSEFLYFQF